MIRYMRPTFLVFFISMIFINSNSALAFVPESMVLQHKKISFYTPHIFNPKFFGFEFGFVTKKNIKSYHFNAFAKLLIAEEFYTTSSTLRAGALGVKAGVIMPTQPWIPIYFEFAIGFAKTALHVDPWLGDREDSLQSKDLLLAEAGVIFRYKEKMLFRINYQVNTLKYFTKKTFVSVGFNF